MGVSLIFILKSGDHLSSQHERLIVFVILGVFPLIGMGVDLITPSLPAISQALNISHTVSKNLIAIYLLGYALGNFFVGFLSDALGRRKFMLAGFVIFILASCLPAVTVHADMLLLIRLLQGLSIGAIAVVSRAILSDILPQEKLIRLATWMATLWGLGPVIGPVIGGYLQYYINWQAGFYFFALYGLLGLTSMIFILPETHFNRQSLNITQLKHNFMTIITHRFFMGSVILMGIAYSLLIVFNTLGPFLIQMHLGYSSVYFGHVALSMGLAFLIGTFICRRLITHYAMEAIVLTTLSVLFGISVVWLILAYLFTHYISIILIPSFILFLGAGVIFPAGMGKGLALFRHLAGSAAALMYLCNVLITSLTALWMSFINADSVIPLAWIYMVLILAAGMVYAGLIFRR